MPELRRHARLLRVAGLLRDALLHLFEPDFSVFYMILSQMGFMYKHQAAYPLGGSLPLATTLEQRYKQQQTAAAQAA